MLELCGLLCSFFIPNFITLFFYILFTLIFFDYYWSALFNKANTIINTISFTHVQKKFQSRFYLQNTDFTLTKGGAILPIILHIISTIYFI